MSNFFVRPTIAGSGDGSSWSNACTTTTIPWSSVAAGDTIWLGGGTHAGQLKPGKSGSDGNPIVIKRATVNDPVAVASSGWLPSFDSQVVIAPASSSPISWGGNSLGQGSYVTIDGQITDGIKLKCPDPANTFYLGGISFGYQAANVHDVIFRNLDIAGPATSSAPYPYLCNSAGLNIVPWDGNNTYSPIYNITLSHCKVHGFPNLIQMLGTNCHDITIENNDLYDNASDSDSVHANVCYLEGTHDIIFRNNKIHDWQVEGIGFGHSTVPLNWYIYGNTFYGQINSSATCFWNCTRGSTVSGPVYLYNNTFINCTITNNQSDQQAFGNGSVSRNNIFYNSFWSAGSQNYSRFPDSDYNHYVGATPLTTEPNSTSWASGNPFVNYPSGDFRLLHTSHTSSDLYVLPGVNLGSPYDVDPLGISRADQAGWSRGAYTYLTALTFLGGHVPVGGQLRIGLGPKELASLFGDANADAVEARISSQISSDAVKVDGNTLSLVLTDEVTNTIFGGESADSIIERVNKIRSYGDQPFFTSYARAGVLDAPPEIDRSPLPTPTPDGDT